MNADSARYSTPKKSARRSARLPNRQPSRLARWSQLRCRGRWGRRSQRPWLLRVVQEHDEEGARAIGQGTLDDVAETLTLASAAGDEDSSRPKVLL